ncbi:MAG: NAD(P)/FAD-dependent oxidoreductase [Myxococcota bacterium]
MRTPLLRSLRRIVADLSLSRRDGKPVDVVREERRQRQEARLISRRALLGGAAAAAGVLALPRSARAHRNRASVAVIGGGRAGMACARRRHKHGVSCKVFEASARIGGRMYSNDSGYWKYGQVTEWGGELIDTGHERIQTLAGLYGLTLDNLHAAEPAGSSEVYKVGGQYYAKADADQDFVDMFDVIADDEAAAGYPTTWDSFTDAGKALDHMSVHQWIATRVPGGHGSPLGKVLDLAYAIEYGADTVDQSALNLLYLLAYQPDDATFNAFGVSDETFHIRGGNQQLPRAIASSLPGGTIQYGHKLVRLKKTAGGRTRCTFEHDGCTVEDTFDYVVLCIPFAVLADLDYSQAGFDDRKRLAIAQLGRGHSAKLQLQFDHRIWAGTGAWPGIANGSTYADGYQSSWEPTRGQPGPGGIINLFSGGSVTNALETNTAFATASNPTVKNDAVRGLAQLGQVFPGLQWNGRATASVWHKNPLAKHGYAYFKVGQYTSFGGYEGVRQGGVLFAGDHTSQDFQGFMEGAATEGERAASELLDLI